MSCQGAHPGEAVIRQRWRLSFNGQQPSEADTKFVAIKLHNNFFRRRQFLVASNVLGSGYEVFCRESRDRHRVKTLGLGFDSDLYTNQRIGADLLDGSPKCEKLAGRNKDP